MSTYGQLKVDNLNFQNSGVEFLKITATSNGTTTFSSASGNVILAGVATPTADNQAATKAYVDAIATAGASWKNSVRAATTANITLSGTQTIDGVELVADDRVLVKNQSTASENGIYVVALGSWTRDTDLPAGGSAAGAAVWVNEGTTQGDKGFICTNDSGSDVVGTDNLVFTNFSSAPAVAGSDTYVQYNNNGYLGASSDFTWDGTSLQLGDAKNFVSGAGDELTIGHTGSAGVGSITNSVGDFTIENTSLTGDIKFVLGNNSVDTLYTVQNVDALFNLLEISGDGLTKIRTGDDTSSTSFSVQNSSGTDTFVIGGDNVATMSSGSTLQLADSVQMQVGDGDDLIVVSDGANSSITAANGTFSLTGAASSGAMTIQSNSTTAGVSLLNTAAGDITINNQFATGDTIIKMGDASAATSVQFNNSSDVNVMTIGSDPTVNSTSTTSGAVKIVGGLGITLDVYAQSFNASSDATLKTNIEPLNDSLKTLKSIEGYSYDWIKDLDDNEKPKQWGVLAQQLEEVGLGHMVSKGEVKAVNYLMLIPLLIEAVKELSDDTENKFKNLNI